MTASSEGAKFSVEENVWIPLQDGRRLAARVWLPRTIERVPAILEYLPYRKRGGTEARDDVNFAVFAEHGYAGVRVDIAGTGESDGALTDEYTEDEHANGCAVIAWIASQNWCDGNVGMFGISWGGFNSLQVAMRRPPALKAVVSLCATADRYADDAHYMGGCLLTDNHTWAAQMTSIMTSAPAAEFRPDWKGVWLERLRNLPRFAPGWLAHQRRDAYWKHGSLCEDWNSPTVAILQIGGWADPYRNTAALVVQNADKSAKGLMGPWDHQYPHLARVGEPADFHGELLRWFDCYLRGVENGAENLPAYRAFVRTFHPSAEFGPRPGYWVEEAQMPSPAIKTKSFGMAADGTLKEGVGCGIVPLATTSLTGRQSGNFCPGMMLENELPGDQAEADALSLCFETSPLENDVEILGGPEVSLTLRSDQPFGQVVARLCEVDPDGRSMLVGFKPMNLTQRESRQNPSVLPTDRSVSVKISLGECAHLFAKGNRIRLALSNGYWPLVWPAPFPTKFEIDLASSALSLPVREGGKSAIPLGPARKLDERSSTELLPAAGFVRRSTTPDGTEVFETFNDFGRSRSNATGDESAASVKVTYRLNPANQTAPEVEVEWRKSFRTNGSDIVTKTRHRQTSDATHFITSAELLAFLDGEQVFADKWTDRTSRDHL